MKKKNNKKDHMNNREILSTSPTKCCQLLFNFYFALSEKTPERAGGGGNGEVC